MRPADLADVVSIALADTDYTLEMACNELCDEFYLDYPDRARMKAHLDPEPPIIGDPTKDALIGAIGEHLARRWGLTTPPWTARAEHFALKAPIFMPPSDALRSLLIAESPPAFRSRMLFTMAEPLERARFPADVPRVRMPWDDRPTLPRRRAP